MSKINVLHFEAVRPRGRKFRSAPRNEAAVRSLDGSGKLPGAVSDTMPHALSNQFDVPRNMRDDAYQRSLSIFMPMLHTA